MLYPFWGKNPEDPGDPSSGRYDRYAEVGSRLFEMATLEKADVAVFPGAWEQVLGDKTAVGLAEQFLELARQARKPTVIFFWSDSDEAISYDNTVVFRTSCYRSRKRNNEFAMPAWSEDFVTRYLGGQLPLRAKNKKPMVGFCGYAPGYETSHPTAGSYVLHFAKCGVRACKRLLKSLVGMKRPASSIRAVVLRALAASDSVDTNFVIREHFLGGSLLPSGELDAARMETVRKEYVQNMVHSDYAICARGGGNFSYRLYEALCCGRIPVFVDTDCLLPFHSEIAWKEYCVWIGEGEIGHLADKVAEFHESLSDRQFVELQRECRRLWDSHLSPEGFFANFYKHFK
jgi:exostosin family protein